MHLLAASQERLSELPKCPAGSKLHGQERRKYVYNKTRDTLRVLVNAEILTQHRDTWVPVTTAWRVLRLRMGYASNMEGSCEYIE